MPNRTKCVLLVSVMYYAFHSGTSDTLRIPTTMRIAFLSEVRTVRPAEARIVVSIYLCGMGPRALGGGPNRQTDRQADRTLTSERCEDLKTDRQTDRQDTDLGEAAQLRL
jgi:hypothetical protein